MRPRSYLRGMIFAARPRDASRSKVAFHRRASSLEHRGSGPATVLVLAFREQS